MENQCLFYFVCSTTSIKYIPFCMTLADLEFQHLLYNFEGTQWATSKALVSRIHPVGRTSATPASISNIENLKSFLL